MVATRWVPIIALILFLLGSISLKSSAFHTHSSVVVGRLNNGAMMLVSSMTMINNDESIIITMRNNIKEQHKLLFHMPVGISFLLILHIAVLCCGGCFRKFEEDNALWRDGIIV
jgi:hypothetical protein